MEVRTEGVRGRGAAATTWPGVRRDIITSDVEGLSGGFEASRQGKAVVSPTKSAAHHIRSLVTNLCANSPVLVCGTERVMSLVRIHKCHDECWRQKLQTFVCLSFMNCKMRSATFPLSPWLVVSSFVNSRRLAWMLWRFYPDLRNCLFLKKPTGFLNPTGDLWRWMKNLTCPSVSMPIVECSVETSIPRKLTANPWCHFK